MERNVEAITHFHAHRGVSASCLDGKQSKNGCGTADRGLAGALEAAG
jgi:hypothetical protein